MMRRGRGRSRQEAGGIALATQQYIRVSKFNWLLRSTEKNDLALQFPV